MPKSLIKTTTFASYSNSLRNIYIDNFKNLRCARLSCFCSNTNPQNLTHPQKIIIRSYSTNISLNRLFFTLKKKFPLTICHKVKEMLDSSNHVTCKSQYMCIYWFNLIKLQPANFPWSKHVIRLHKLPAKAM